MNSIDKCIACPFMRCVRPFWFLYHRQYRDGDGELLALEKTSLNMFKRRYLCIMNNPGCGSLFNSGLIEAPVDFTYHDGGYCRVIPRKIIRLERSLYKENEK